MTSTSYSFIITKSSNLPLYYYYFFLYMYNYAFIDSLIENRYYKTSSYCGGFDPGDVWSFIASLSGYS
jgi:hypothetical protein